MSDKNNKPVKFVLPSDKGDSENKKIESDLANLKKRIVQELKNKQK